MNEFKKMLLNHLFYVSHQWTTFIQFPEAEKKPIYSGYQEHFYHWLNELILLYSPKITKGKGYQINIKKFSIRGTVICTTI